MGQSGDDFPLHAWLGFTVSVFGRGALGLHAAQEPALGLLVRRNLGEVGSDRAYMNDCIKSYEMVDTTISSYQCFQPS